MATPEPLGDLEHRMQTADEVLRDLADQQSCDERAAHLRSKAEGVRLALSYVSETKRLLRPLRGLAQPLSKEITDAHRD